MFVTSVDSSYPEPFSYLDTACAFVYYNLVPKNMNERINNQIEEALSIRSTVGNVA